MSVARQWLYLFSLLVLFIFVFAIDTTAAYSCGHGMRLVSILSRNTHNSIELACLCPPSTACDGSACRRGHHVNKSSEIVSGYSTPCTDCTCKPIDDNSASLNKLSDDNENKGDIYPPFSPKTLLYTGINSNITLRPLPSILKRRKCVQRHISSALGYRDFPSYFMVGCQHEAIFDFDSWAANTGCGSEPIEGDGILYIHTGMYSYQFSSI